MQTAGVDGWEVLVDSLTTTSYTVNGLSADTIYQFVIQARNSIGYSSSSSIIEVRASGVPDAPATPTT